MEESPESATVLGYRGHDHRWSDLSPDAIARSREDARASLDALRSIDPSGLDEVDRLSWLLFEKGREDELESARFHPEYQPVN